MINKQIKELEDKELQQMIAEAELKYDEEYELNKLIEEADQQFKDEDNELFSLLD